MSPDSSIVITFDTLVGQHHFGLIHVKLSKQFDDSLEREGLLVYYLDFLKTAFGIKESTGYGKGHFLENYQNVQGIIDFWQDEKKIEYAIKAWVSPKYVSVFMIYGTTEYPIYNVKEMYFNSIRYY